MAVRKIEIKAITNENALQVCFSIPRRSGLFENANELSILFGAQVAVLFFGAGIKLIAVFFFDNQDADSIINRFTEDQQHLSSSSSIVSRDGNVGEVSKQLMELDSLIEKEKERRTMLASHQEIFSSVFDGVNMEELGLAELKRYEELAMESRSQILTIQSHH